MTTVFHDKLACGLECGIAPLPHRHVVSMQIRLLSGICSEPAEKLGLAWLLAETIDKGTQSRSGRELADAFDAIGASHGISVGRETTTLTCTVLPEHFEKSVALHAEFLRTPTFPEDMFDASVDLAQQELIALEDDAQGVIDKLMGFKAYGHVLGRHPLGERETLERITRSDLEDHWRGHFHAGRMIVTLAGPLEPSRIVDVLAKQFDGYGSADRAGRETFPVEFAPSATHHQKELEQEHISICWPGIDATSDEFPTQQVTLGILAGGMSGRLFTEVREKLGLVYYVNAWQETPRGAGMIFLGASTTPERCDQTYETLLREVDRLAEDIEQDELDRAVTGILAQRDTRGDTTRACCSELANDLFFFGRQVPKEEKAGKIRAVTPDRIRQYLSTHPRDQRCVVTLGPRALEQASAKAEQRQEPAST